MPSPSLPYTFRLSSPNTVICCFRPRSDLPGPRWCWPPRPRPSLLLAPQEDSSEQWQAGGQLWGRLQADLTEESERDAHHVRRPSVPEEQQLRGHEEEGSDGGTWEVRAQDGVRQDCLQPGLCWAGKLVIKTSCLGVRLTLVFLLFKWGKFLLL